MDFVPPDWLHDWTRFAEELRDMFGDPNAEATAEADLDGLRMRTNQKFADFLVEFNTLSSQVNWGDRALRHRLKHALPDRIKDSLALVEEPDAFNDWKRLVQNIDQQYWERQAEIRRDTRNSQGNNTNRGAIPTSVCNTTPGAPVTPTSSSARDPIGNPPVARHLTTQGGLTQTEGSRRAFVCTVEGRDTRQASVVRRGRQGRRVGEQRTKRNPCPHPPVLVLRLSNQR